MQFHNFSKKTKNKKARSIGRGGKRGKTSGRGTKGQNARSGRKKRPELRDTIKRLPKLRGRGVNSLKSLITKPKSINLFVIDKNFKDGDKVDIKSLLEKKIVRLFRGKTPQVKILSNGEINKNIEFSNILVSQKAKEKIEKAGGKVL